MYISCLLVGWGLIEQTDWDIRYQSIFYRKGFLMTLQVLPSKKRGVVERKETIVYTYRKHL